MADQSTKTRRQPSRLQRRAPALIQVAPVGHWNVAIPLLSPLATSPDEKVNHHVNEENSTLNRRVVVNGDNNKLVSSEPEKVVPVVYKKWQHPAAPFCYESAPVLLQSVCSAGIVDMS